MELVQKIKRPAYMASDFGIYKLNDAEREKFGNNYAVSQGIFSDYTIKEFGAEKLLSNLKDYAYEGFFETEKEAYLHVKAVMLKFEIERMKLTMKDLLELETPD